MQVYAGYTCSKSIKLYALWGLIQVQAVSTEHSRFIRLKAVSIEPSGVVQVQASSGESKYVALYVNNLFFSYRWS